MQEMRGGGGGGMQGGGYMYMKGERDRKGRDGG